jgi:hypothetical protein
MTLEDGGQHIVEADGALEEAGEVAAASGVVDGRGGRLLLLAGVHIRDVNNQSIIKFYFVSLIIIRIKYAFLNDVEIYYHKL